MRPKEGDLWGRKLADVAWTVYGATRYLEESGGPFHPRKISAATR
jgi:hypothetical protein